MVAARSRGASSILMFGAHLVKNGGASLVTALMSNGWFAHLAANGASAIHDWEFAYQGSSTESVEKNVAKGCFGTWQETGHYLHLALMAGALENRGFGASVGWLIQNDGISLPAPDELSWQICHEPAHPLTAARAELLQVMKAHRLCAGRHELKHPGKQHSIFGQAFRLGIPITVHPGVGYDIISNHPMFNGAAIGRAGGLDFRWFGGAVEQLDGGVVISVGSAIMAPQVFEKSLSCVNNLRLQAGRPIVRDHGIFVVDIQDGGGWDWSRGEPPKDTPAYYLRFLKSFSRMGGRMQYVHCDNIVFLHHLWRELKNQPATGK